MGAQTNVGGIYTPTKRRGPIAAEFSTPGPAALSLPSSFGTSNPASKSRAPAFTISGRHEHKIESASPGPGQYNINGLSYKAGKDEPHAPSMHIRPRDPKPYITPAPGDYCPEKAVKVLEGAPRFSFGVKVDLAKDAGVPAPNSYTIPALIGSNRNADHASAPSFTMSGRPQPDEDKMKVPGPGSYNESVVDKYKAMKSPAFSMGQRTNIPVDHTKKPGPGAHCPEKCMPDDGPKYTMAPRANEEKRMNVPGPGAYNSIDIYSLVEKQPVYTMSPKYELPSDKTPKPGPNAYSPEKCMTENGPKFTMAARVKNPEEKLNVPGPGAYEAGNMSSIMEKQPVFSMASQTELPTDKTHKPAPNAYFTEKVSCLHSESPKFSINGRPKDSEDKDKFPGPGAYTLNPIEKLTTKSPSYTMAPKYELPKDKTTKPGPNYYNIEKANTKKTPEFSFGVKHSKYLGKLRDQ